MPAKRAIFFGSRCDIDVARNKETMPPVDGELYGSGAVAKKAGMSLRQLYHWVDILHVVQPQMHQHGARQFRRFTSGDIKVLKQMGDLVEQGYVPKAAAALARGDKPRQVRDVR